MFSAANDILPPLMSSLRPTPPPRPQHPNETPRDGRIRAPCMIRGVSAAKRAPPWQDLHAVYSRKAICRAFRMHGAHILPKPARFGCMAAICCQEKAFFPPEPTFGMHGMKNLPRIAAQGRTRAKYCHRQAPGTASRRNIATDCRPRTHRGVTELGGTAQTKHLPIQHHALTRPRNREIILVPSAKKLRRKQARVLWRT